MRSSPPQNHLYDHLRQRILSLDLKPGCALSEAQLARDYGVSRTPIREALIRLAGEGLIDNSARHRTFVAPIRYDAVMDGQFAREALETAIVHDVAQNMTDAIRKSLNDNLKRQKKAVEKGNLDRLYELDDRMHQSLAMFSRRPGIWKFVVERKVHTDRLRKLTLFPDHLPDLLAQHNDIVGALNDQDPDGAADAMRRHLRYIVEHYRDLGRRFPEFIEWRFPEERPRSRHSTTVGRPPILSASEREDVLEFLNTKKGTGVEAARRFGVSTATISRIRKEG